MTLITHGERKYQGASQLMHAAEFANLRVEHRRLDPGHHEPGLCESNELAFVISGRTFALQINNYTTHRAFIQPGVACILPAGTFESASANASTIETLHIYLPRTLIERSAMADYDIDPAKVELSFTPGLRDPILYQIGMGFRSVLGREAEPADRIFVDGMQAALAGHLLGNYSIDRWRPRPRKPEFDVKRLKRVLDYIEARFAEEVTLSDLAREACLSEFHFSRLFREATGLSPLRFVTLRRVQEAQKRLQLDRSSLAEIALQTGFGSQANFIRVFGKSTGLTPGQYRALRRAKQPISACDAQRMGPFAERMC